jgi:hypothetical protein
MSFSFLQQRAVLTAALTLSATGVLEAQAPGRIDACYVPVSGTIYRRNTVESPAPGAPNNCLTPAHVAFVIQGGSTIGPDLVYSGKIEMGQTASFGGSLLAKELGGGPAFTPSGAGSRFMWVGERAALRAGTVTGDQWDWAKLGMRSTAIGRNAQASADDALALGESAVAEHKGATVISAGTGIVRSSTEDQLTLRGAGGVRLMASSIPAANCTVTSGGAMNCAGGVTLGNSELRGGGSIELVPSPGSPDRCSVSSQATLTCAGGVGFFASTIFRRSSDIPVAALSTRTAGVLCPSTHFPIGGGVETEGGDLKVRESTRSGESAWSAKVRNDDPFDNGTMRVTVVCALR